MSNLAARLEAVPGLCAACERLDDDRLAERFRRDRDPSAPEIGPEAIDAELPNSVSPSISLH